MRRLFLSLSLVFAFLLFAALPCGAANANRANDNKANDIKTPAETAETLDLPRAIDDEAWSELLQMQRGQVENIGKATADASREFRELSETLSQNSAVFEERANELMERYRVSLKWHNGLEAVGRTIVMTKDEVRADLQPFFDKRQGLLDLLKELDYSNLTKQEDLQADKLGEEASIRAREHAQARMRLMAALSQCFTVIAPARATMQRLEQAEKDIAAALPGIWKEFYLHGWQHRLDWTSPRTWQSIASPRAMLVAMQARLPVELPITADGWLDMGKRLATALLLGGFLVFVCRQRFAGPGANAATRHLCNASLPVLALGLALLYASFDYAGHTFRLVMAVGNLCLIVGQVQLAWDLRRGDNADLDERKSPLLDIVPLTFASYVLFYLPLPPATRFASWLLCLVAALVCRRFRNRQPIAGMHLENTMLESEGLVLWLCLLLTLAGLHRYSMLAYMFFVSTALSLQLSMGGIAHANNLNEHLPSEGVRAVLASLLVALAAPLILVVAVLSVLLWVATLPGGYWLLDSYVFETVTVGATTFNLWKILLLISLFFLTRASILLLSRFLGELPKRIKFDETFVPPVQTALTYALWALFGLYVLRSLGLELSNLAMVATGLSVGIGMGMQGIVSNFFSGLLLIFGRMLQVGDVVEVGGVTGRVRKISVRDTLVETYDSAMIYVPNSEFIAGRLTNWTRNNPIVRGKILIGVAYGSDTALVKKLLLKIAGEHEAVLKYPAPSVVFTDFGASSLDFTLRYWVDSYDASLGAASDIRMEIDRRFAEHHIEIAFPQMDVHVKELPPRAKKRTPPAATQRPHAPRLLRVRPNGAKDANVERPAAPRGEDDGLEDLREQRDD